MRVKKILLHHENRSQVILFFEKQSRCRGTTTRKKRGTHNQESGNVVKQKQKTKTKKQANKQRKKQKTDTKVSVGSPCRGWTE